MRPETTVELLLKPKVKIHAIESFSLIYDSYYYLLSNSNYIITGNILSILKETQVKILSFNGIFRITIPKFKCNIFNNKNY